MHLLMTSDCTGGVGIYAATLAAELQARGHRVSRARCGTPPEAPPAAGAELRLPAPLEWESGSDVAALAAAVAGGRAALAAFAAANAAEPIDVLHCNQFAWAGAVPGVPSVVVVHSDVVSWWRAVHGVAPPNTPYRRWYTQLVRESLEQAAAVVAPTVSALADLRESFQWQGTATVIANGSDLPAVATAGPRQGAVCAGRLGDAGKQVHLLMRPDLPLEITLAGGRKPGQAGLPDSVPGSVRFTGLLDRRAMAELLAQSRIYVAPSRYEPFGLAPLEAARAGCCLLLNDIPSFREVWGPTAFYFARNDGDDLRRWLQRLAGDDALVAAGAAAVHRRALDFSAERMAGAYEALYGQIRAGTPLRA